MTVADLKKLLEKVPDDYVVGASDPFGNVLVYDTYNFSVAQGDRSVVAHGWGKPTGKKVRCLLIDQLDVGPEPD